jgi:hypothetical protein
MWSRNYLPFRSTRGFSVIRAVDRIQSYNKHMEMENLSNEMTLYEIDQLVVEFFYAMSRLHE